MREDLEHLRLLAIFHFVVAGLLAICACFPVIHLAVGIAIVSGALGTPADDKPPPEFIGWLFILLASAFIMVGWAVAIGLAVAGRLLQCRRGYMFCLVMAAIVCLFTPFGTVLGIFTLIVLLRPSVKALFDTVGGCSAAEDDSDGMVAHRPRDW